MASSEINILVPSSAAWMLDKSWHSGFTSDMIVPPLESTMEHRYLNIGINTLIDGFKINISEELENFNATNETTSLQRDDDLVIWEITTLVIIFISTVFGNVLVICILLLRQKKITRMCYFILSLCVSDLITAFFNVLPQLAWEITYKFHGGDFLCRAVKYGQLLGPYLSSYLLVMTALDRYMAICHPLSNCSWTPRTAKNMILVAWLLAVLFCIPQVFIFSIRQRTSDHQWDCWANFILPWGPRAYVTWYALSEFFVPLIILTILYSCICQSIWLNAKTKKASKFDKQTYRGEPRTSKANLFVNLHRQRRSQEGLIVTRIHKSSMSDSDSSLNHHRSASLLNSPFRSSREERRLLGGSLHQHQVSTSEMFFFYERERVFVYTAAS
ncbi:unnamed protein product [Meganyctiphanes norvegica]|uniref:G-protein coupled receptors family 1 profile domain-containing protein n=1 Tax=Meganyctiphanes norvegica TaxID=48144 RepID=A0AAV2R8S2_MEGNR